MVSVTVRAGVVTTRPHGLPGAAIRVARIMLAVTLPARSCTALISNCSHWYASTRLASTLTTTVTRVSTWVVGGSTRATDRATRRRSRRLAAAAAISPVKLAVATKGFISAVLAATLAAGSIGYSSVKVYLSPIAATVHVAP